ncbi:MAG TPA: hypothetical protein VMI73_31045 [Trebonia sp.]|nr:hypothetical protein [Trebonia sp.]
MRARKLRVLAVNGVVAACVAVLASACSGSSSTLANGQPASATPTVTPTAVPVLGDIKLATFPQTWDGMRALQVCEQWVLLRGEYVTRVQKDNTLQLQLWFSSNDWLTAFNANSALKVDPSYMHISTDLGIVTAPGGAGISAARMLDASCAAGN